MNWFKDKDLTARVDTLVLRADDQRKQLEAFMDTYRLEQELTRGYDVGYVRVCFDWAQFEVFIDGKIVAWGPDSRQAMLHFKEWFHEGEEN